MLTDLPKELILPPACVPMAEATLEELERILASPTFKATPRRRKLLRYLVEEMLAGRGRELKGYTIATLVFDREDNFDPQSDPVVRLEARRLRHDLDGYYVSDGSDSPLRISIPKGQYVPVIEHVRPPVEPSSTQSPVSEMSAPAQVVEEVQADAGQVRSIAFQYRLQFALACIALLLGSIVYAFVKSAPDSGNLARDGWGTSLVVLPFATSDGNPESSLLAGGMADEITSSISRFGGVRLYMPSGKENALSGNDPIAIGRSLGLAYVVNGSLDLDGNNETLRVTARLIDVETQRIVWIGSYDRNYLASSLRSVHQEIANSIASALGQPYGVLSKSDIGRIVDPATTAMSSYECVLQAYAYRRSLTRALHTPVLSCLQEAVKRDPHYVDAWAMLAWLYMDEGRFGWLKEGTKEVAFRRAVETAQHALGLDHNNISALKALSSTLHYMGDFAQSERVQRQAYALNPNDPDTLAQLGWRLAVRDNFKEGIPLLKQAIERSVNPPGWYYHLIAIDQYLNGRYEEMLATAQRSTVDVSGVSWSLVAIAQGALGRQEEARKALAEMSKKSTLLATEPASVYRRHQAVDRIVDALVSGLRKAGWKENTAPEPV